MPREKNTISAHPLSKYFFYVLLITVPIITFYIGTYHQKKVYQVQQTKTNDTPQIITDNGLKTYTRQGFEIDVPSEYTLDTNSSSERVVFSTKKGNEEKNITISIEQTNLRDPCIQQFEGYPNIQCTTINEYRALDKGTDKPPYTMGPLEYNYSLINNDKLYTIQFLGIEAPEKNQIISTFKFTN
jgi:hypothetical protein